jgi:lysophospholipase L1-like esterase
MKKKIVVLLMSLSITALSVTGCNNRITDVIVRESDVESGSLETEASETSNITETDESISETTVPESETETDDNTIESESASLEEESYVDISSLTEGELAARREQQLKFDEARQLLYDLDNSKDKTIKINQMDRQIIANNTYDFSDKNIVFIGDSITEGVTGAVSSDGTLVSYPDYVESKLHFNRFLNHGKAGRMFSDYGGEELSLAFSFGDVINVDSDIIVVFAGANDYLSAPENKEFGNINNKESTAGYCGMVRYFMKQLDYYCGDKDVFFVMMYNIEQEVEPVYSDIATEPTLGDYLDVQRTIAKEYGFNIIDLYSVGFMDCTDSETEAYFLNDKVHPSDNGSIVLGEHIAAEVSLYYGQQ